MRPARRAAAPAAAMICPHPLPPETTTWRHARTSGANAPRTQARDVGANTSWVGLQDEASRPHPPCQSHPWNTIARLHSVVRKRTGDASEGDGTCGAHALVHLRGVLLACCRVWQCCEEFQNIVNNLCPADRRPAPTTQATARPDTAALRVRPPQNILTHLTEDNLLYTRAARALACGSRDGVRPALLPDWSTSQVSVANAGSGVHGRGFMDG